MDQCPVFQDGGLEDAYASEHHNKRIQVASSGHQEPTRTPEHQVSSADPFSRKSGAPHSCNSSARYQIEPSHELGRRPLGVSE